MTAHFLQVQTDEEPEKPFRLVVDNSLVYKNLHGISCTCWLFI